MARKPYVFIFGLSLLLTPRSPDDARLLSLRCMHPRCARPKDDARLGKCAEMTEAMYTLGRARATPGRDYLCNLMG